MPGSRAMASLTPTMLLARKGSARPSMRPQDGLTISSADDLGWNDFGISDRRASLTLRLDAQRHDQLRNAALLLDRSAQRIVTEALDKFLSEIPEVAASAITRRQQ